jgi:hypothetical protein
MEAAAKEDEHNISILLCDVACAMKTWWMSPSNVHGAPGPPSQIDTDRVRACCIHNSKLPKSMYLKHLDLQTHISTTQPVDVEARGECC